MSDKNEKEAEEAAEKVAEKVVEKAEEEIKKTTEKAQKEVEKAGKEVAKKVKAAAEETEVFLVGGGSPVIGKTVEEIDDLELLGEDALIVEVERGDETMTPKGETKIEAGDTVTITSSSGISDKTRRAFSGK